MRITKRVERTGYAGGEAAERLGGAAAQEAAEPRADPRGYTLFGRDGYAIGVVTDVITAPSSAEAPLVLVSPGGLGGATKVAIPLEILGVNDFERKVYAPFVQADFDRAPEYRPDEPDFRPALDYWKGRHPG